MIKYEDGFLFSNPGNLKLPVRAIYEGGHSIARNPKLQNMFRMIGLGDNIGSGFPTILKEWGEENWRQPDLYDDQELHQVAGRRANNFGYGIFRRKSIQYEIAIRFRNAFSRSWSIIN